MGDQSVAKYIVFFILYLVFNKCLKIIYMHVRLVFKPRICGTPAFCGYGIVKTIAYADVVLSILRMRLGDRRRYCLL